MRVTLGLPTHRVDLLEQFGTAEAVMELAKEAEAAGFDAVNVTEHPFPGDEWMRTGGHHALDPFVALSFAAAATTTLRLHTNLVVLAYRNPFLTAKAVATLDAMSGGRVILGVGAGYLDTEFAALGVDFEERNDLTDEAISAMKVAWSEEGVTLDGRHFRATGNTMLPKPVQKPHPPIWVGGNSARAIRRAVELADGWSPMPNTAATVGRRRTPALDSVTVLRERIAYAREHAARIGRSAPLDIVFIPMGADMYSPDGLDRARFVDEAAELADAGVTWLVVSVPGAGRAAVVDNIRSFGADVLPGLRAIAV